MVRLTNDTPTLIQITLPLEVVREFCEEGRLSLSFSGDMEISAERTIGDEEGEMISVAVSVPTVEVVHSPKEELPVSGDTVVTPADDTVTTPGGDTVVVP